MEKISINGLMLFFHADEQETAKLIAQTCKKSIQLIQQHWGLNTPEDCRLYVMTSWLRFVFHSAPWNWRVLLGLSLPLWVSRVKKVWLFAGGWAQRYGKRQAVGIKPPRLLQRVDRTMGEQIFIKESDINGRLQRITCHELAHAYTAHLKLPMWLNEGLAMVMVDKFFGRPTVRTESLDILTHHKWKPEPGSYWKLRKGDKYTMVFHYIRSYWLTRYLEEMYPELIKELLSKRHKRKILEDRIGATLGMEAEGFWKSIDNILVSNFR